MEQWTAGSVVPKVIIEAKMDFYPVRFQKELLRYYFSFPFSHTALP